MRRVVRRSYRYDFQGNLVEVKTPVMVGELDESEIEAMYLMCAECKHKKEVPIGILHGEDFVPDVGLRYKCSKCGCDEIESWPKYKSTILPMRPL